MVAAKPLHEPERAVVQRQAEDRAVVGVHHAVAEAQRLPHRDQAGLALDHVGQPERPTLEDVSDIEQVSEVPLDRVVGQHGEWRGRSVARVVLEMAEAQEARRHAAHDRRRLGALALHRQRRRHQRQRARGRHAQRVHRFAGQVFADRRAQHRAPVGAARIRGRSGALELQLTRPRGGVDLGDQQRTTVTELAGVATELVTGVDGRARRVAGPGTVAGQQRGGIGPPPQTARQLKLGRQRLVADQPDRRRQRRGRCRDAEGRTQCRQRCHRTDPPGAASSRCSSCARCSDSRPAPSRICCRQLVPLATMWVCGCAARTAGSNASSAMRIEWS